MSRFRRPDLGEDFGYTPGEQPGKDEDWLKLNTNEAPLPPSPLVGEAVLGAASMLQRYPSPDGEPLRGALARHHGVAPEQIFVANGGDQVLDCCYRAFAGPGATVVRASPSYSLFPVLARLFSAHDVAVQLLPDGNLDPEFAAEAGSLRMVVNPNSPTGAWIAPDRLEEQLEGATGVVVIDEAYCDFAPASMLPKLATHPNWLVLRTFSKSHALAGLRVGYAVGDREVINDLHAVKDSYPVDSCAIAGALAALEDEEHHHAIVSTVREQRGRLQSELAALQWNVLPSEANFVFARPPARHDAARVAERLRASRILVRHFTQPGLDDGLRISVGDAAGVDRLLEALAHITPRP